MNAFDIMDKKIDMDSNDFLVLQSKAMQFQPIIQCTQKMKDHLGLTCRSMGAGWTLVCPECGIATFFMSSGATFGG